MSERSSRRSAQVAAGVALVVLAAGGCGGGRKAPEADPDKVRALAHRILSTDPVPGGGRPCTPAELTGGATLTELTARTLAKAPPSRDPTHAEWINPVELDSPAAITLIDPAASTLAKRQAAAELLAARFYLLYRIEHIAAPLALGIKEMKRGSIGARALRYDRDGRLVCLTVFNWLNDDTVSRRAFVAAEKDFGEAVTKAVRDDLRAQYLKKVQSLALPQP